MFEIDEAGDLVDSNYDLDTGVFWLNEGMGISYFLSAYLEETPGPGWWVFPKLAGVWIQGDGYSTDDDEDWEISEPLRMATPEEIEQEFPNL
jgi:hypothetical protein